MINYILVVPILLSFLISLLFTPFWIKKAKRIGLLWNDMNKTSKERVAGSGGIITVLAFIIGILIFISYRTFVLKSNDFLIELLAMLVVVLFLAGVGFVDDLLGWQMGGLRRRHRIILVLLAAIPLMVINAGKSEIGLPLFGTIELGILYPLIIIPLGIVGATTTFNFLAGFNGLEAGQGILLMVGTGLVAYFTGSSWLFVVSLCMAFSLLAFLVYNFFPAKVFPGDSLTYGVGGLIAIIAILGNFEKVAVFFFIPYIMEFFLKARGKLIKQSFGKPKKDGSLDLRENNIYGLGHLAIWLLNKKGRATEKKVVYLIWTFQLVIIILGFIIFRTGIFK
ncbi:hypothetical protein AUJ84_01920 [Candidatus Pacearchaeota archaeon CG1_02_32_132]|nr:MAG: hypothetical protein AUJ84_01920 [Candidatus Pacearchaeota archaeon CG1_02_32_132]